jgi:ribosomal protein S18 acetylase RimI-like enzyme
MPLPEMIRIDEQDWEERRRLLADGWREIEVLETWAGSTQLFASPVRLATPSDLPAMLRIARESFEFDRLHVDDEVSKVDADEAKERHVVQAMHSSEWHVYVYGERPCGFLIARAEDGILRVELIAVNLDHRGRGVAQALIRFAASDLAFCKTIVAGTQMHNDPAKRLYGFLGMSVQKMERTFHK